MNTSEEWHYIDATGQQLGPISIEQLKQLTNVGVVNEQTQVWSEGMEEWVLASAVEGLLPETSLLTSEEVQAPTREPVLNFGSAVQTQADAPVAANPTASPDVAAEAPVQANPIQIDSNSTADEGGPQINLGPGSRSGINLGPSIQARPMGQPAEPAAPATGFAGSPIQPNLQAASAQPQPDEQGPQINLGPGSAPTQTPGSGINLGPTMPGQNQQAQPKKLVPYTKKSNTAVKWVVGLIIFSAIASGIYFFNESRRNQKPKVAQGLGEYTKATERISANEIGEYSALGDKGAGKIAANFKELFEKKSEDENSNSPPSAITNTAIQSDPTATLPPTSDQKETDEEANTKEQAETKDQAETDSTVASDATTAEIDSNDQDVSSTSNPEEVSKPEEKLETGPQDISNIPISVHVYAPKIDIDKSVIIFVKVTNLHELTNTSKQELMDKLWVSSKLALANTPFSDAKTNLVVAVRGMTSYDRLLVGHPLITKSTDTNPQEGISETYNGSDAEKVLIPYFE